MAEGGRALSGPRSSHDLGDGRFFPDDPSDNLEADIGPTRLGVGLAYEVVVEMD